MSTTQPSPPILSEEDAVKWLETVPSVYQSISQEMSKRIVGQHEVIHNLFICLLAQGHCLMIGAPGLAKTLIVRSLAEMLELDFQRIQFTPDLMPSDITGSEILEETREGGRIFRFVPGAIFAQLLLADEINRTPPKTQAALLEAMQEHHVTIAGQTYPLKSPFFVLATQNPIEQEGTYPLPEAQVDRFMFCLKVGYPSLPEEVEVLLKTTREALQPLNKVLTGEQIVALQQAVRQIHVPESVAKFAVTLVHSTRPTSEGAPDIVKRYIRWGAGPRASQYLALAGKAAAALDGRLNVAIEDIITAAPMVLRHRLIANFRAEADQINVDDIVSQLVKSARTR